MIFIVFALGVILVVKGGDIFVESASFIAEKTGVPRFIIGATIVSVATTLPELLVSVIAAINGSAEMAAGNAVGSIICNVALIMGISALCKPSKIKRFEILEKGFLMILSAALLFASLLNSRLSVLESIVLLCVFLFFLYVNVCDKNGKGIKSKMTIREKLISFIKFVFGAFAIVAGAKIIVEAGISISRLWGVPESVIAFTLIAISTSLPELVTTITAIRKGESAIGIGNIIGANIIDVCLILPVCTLIKGGSLILDIRDIGYDLLVMIGVMIVMIVPVAIMGKFTRLIGALLLIMYTIYIFSICTAL